MKKGKIIFPLYEYDRPNAYSVDQEQRWKGLAVEMLYIQDGEMP